MTNDFQPDNVPMILRRLRPATLARPIQTHTHFHFTPRLNFTVVQAPAEAAALRIESILRNTGGERVERREEIVKRIAVGHERRERGSTAVASESPVAPGPLAARARVPAVLLRQAVPLPAAPQTSSPAVAERAWPPPQSTQAPPMDLERLSDKVMQNLDRRLQAHIERTGRR